MTTRNLVPRANNEGKLGISSKKWAEVNATNGTFSTLKVSGSLKVDAVADLDLFTSGAGIESITTNVNNQFVIAIDDTFLTNLGFNANGTKPDFAANGTVLAGDSFVTAINKLDQAVSNVADPADLDVSNFSATAILSGSETFVDDDTNLMTAAAVNDRILSFGYTTNIGDITRINITAGTGLTGSVDTESGDHTQTINLADTAVTSGSYGSPTSYPTFTVDSQGRLTAAGNQAISTSFTLSADTGADDTFNTGETLHISGSANKIETSIADNIFTIDLADTDVAAGTYGDANNYPTFTVDAQGRLTAAGNQAISTSFTLSADTGADDTFNTGETLHISGSANKIETTIADNIFTIDLADTAVTNGDYGSATQVATFTVDQQGRLTAAANEAIAIPSTAVTDFTEAAQDVVSDQLVTNGSHTGIAVAYDDAGDGAIDLTVQNLTLTQFSGSAIQTEAEVSAGGGAAGFGDNDTSLLTAAAIKQYIDAQGFGIGTGDISRVNITAGIGLDGTVDTLTGDHTQTIDLANTAVTAGDYGSATQVVALSVDAQGRLTAAANEAIAIPSTAVTDFTEAVQDAVAFQLVTSGSHTGISAAYDDAGDGAIDLTVSVAAGQIQDGAVTANKLNDDIISGQDELAAGLSETDELLVNDAGTVKRMDISVLKTFFDRGGDGELDFTVNTDVNVSKANLSASLASFTGDDTIYIGDDGNDTSLIVRGDLTVRGTTTTVDSTTIAVSSSFTFEGPIDDHETTLTIVDPTADHTIYLPNQGGYIPVLDVASTTQITSTPEEINLLDGSAANTVENGKAVIYSNAGNVNATSFTGPLTGDVTGNADTASAWANSRTLTFASGDITGSLSLDGSVDIENIELTINSGSVESHMIANDAIGADQLAINAVVNASIAADAAIDIDKIDWTSENNTQIDFSQNDKLFVYDTDGGSIKSMTLSNFEDSIFGNVSGDVTIAPGGALTISGSAVENSMLAGGITNDKLVNSTISFGGVELALGEVDATPAFNLSDATNIPAGQLEGTIDVARIADDSITNIKLKEITTAAKVNVSSINLSGSTAIGALAKEDIILVDDNASGANRKATLEQFITFLEAEPTLNSLSSLDTVGTIGTGTWEGDVIADAYVANDLTISGGTINNTVIGGVTPVSGTFTALIANDSLIINGSDAIVAVDTDLTGGVSANDDTIASAKAIKTYVDTQLSGHCLFVAADNTDGATNRINVSLADEEKLQFVGGTGVTTTAVETADAATNDTVTIAIDNSVVATLTDSQTLTNKVLMSPTISGSLYVSGSSMIFEGSSADEFETTLTVANPTADRTITFPDATDTLVGLVTTGSLFNKTINVDPDASPNNTLTGVTTGSFKAGVIDTNLNAVDTSNSTIPTANAVKEYVDAQVGRFGGIFKTSEVDGNGIYDVEFDSSPLIRSHFGPFAFDLGQLYSSGGSDISFYGATAAGASDRHFLVITVTDVNDASYGAGETVKGDCLFTGADADTP